MVAPTLGGLMKTSVVYAFSLAAALIWKDVIVEFIEIIVPPGEELMYKCWHKPNWDTGSMQQIKYRLVAIWHRKLGNRERR